MSPSERPFGWWRSLWGLPTLPIGSHRPLRCRMRPDLSGSLARNTFIAAGPAPHIIILAGFGPAQQRDPILAGEAETTRRNSPGSVRCRSRQHSQSAA
jgi:hypothetical protein